MKIDDNCNFNPINDKSLNVNQNTSTNLQIETEINSSKINAKNINIEELTTSLMKECPELQKLSNKLILRVEGLD